MIINPLILGEGKKWHVAYASEITDTQITFPTITWCSHIVFFRNAERSTTTSSTTKYVIGGYSTDVNSGTASGHGLLVLKDSLLKWISGYNVRTTWSSVTIGINTNLDEATNCKFDTNSEYIAIYTYLGG